ncbi:MarR family transcriptional regulator [Ochrobactrum sp. RH2CCR150]|uniref:MarR family winged helix-turn-helix transcriptional regulator n=1 Tax=Ochrobactrum sp. RH2CCR150 TaxID=2587044 RepID=UPI0015FB5F33|nr:DNA-binding MarR family transcriptional regulator [Ochrobactrum sp. RH2CCR150]
MVVEIGHSEELTERDHVDRLRSQWINELPDLDTEPMGILGRASRLTTIYRAGMEMTFATFDLDRGEFDVIATLRRSGPPYRLTPTEIYTSLMISSGGLTHRLDRLEKAGLVRREKSEKDGRSMLVALTDAGVAKVEAACRAHMAKGFAFLEPLDKNERVLLAGLLKKLLLSIENASQR